MTNAIVVFFAKEQNISIGAIGNYFVDSYDLFVPGIIDLVIFIHAVL
jgi:hypothetical protein